MGGIKIWGMKFTKNYESCMIKFSNNKSLIVKLAINALCYYTKSNIWLNIH